MSGDINIGDSVKLLRLPSWLLHDLPQSEQTEMRTFIGRIAVVNEIDALGYFWLGFGSTAEAGDSAYYSGHSFGVPRDCIERAGSA